MTLPIRWTMSSVGILGLQGIPVLMKRVGSRWFTFLIDVFLPQTRVWRNKPGKQNYEMDMETQRSTKNPTHKEHQQRRDPDPISEVEWQLRQLGIWSMVVGAEIASGFFRPHAQNKRTDHHAQRDKRKQRHANVFFKTWLMHQVEHKRQGENLVQNRNPNILTTSGVLVDNYSERWQRKRSR